MATQATTAGSQHDSGPHRELVHDHMHSGALTFGTAQSVRQVLTTLVAAGQQADDIVLVSDAQGRLAGALPLARLFALAPEQTMAEVLDSDFPRVGPDTDQETAASLALHHGVDALPVVDAVGRPIGVLPSQALLQILRREHVEDLHRLAGIDREVSQARHAIEDPPLRRARHRLPWLFVGLAGSAVSTLAMAAFETTMQARSRSRFLFRQSSILPTPSALRARPSQYVDYHLHAVASGICCWVNCAPGCSSGWPLPALPCR